MRGAGLTGASRRRKGVTTTRRDKDARPAPDLVDRDFAAVGRDKLWLADITFVPTATVNDLATLLQSQVANERPEVRLCTAIMRVVYWWLAY